jgi:ParB family chromosome partitioning protein
MKKKYALPQNISSEIGETINLVKSNIGTLNYKIIPIDAIEFDPLNPRELAITRDELLVELSKEDPLYEKKGEELEKLKEIAESIKKHGVRNAVEIYKYGNNYRLIHGERRCLGSILAGKKEIPAKILDEKPTNLDIRLLQLIENAQRQDLTLYETLNNIKLIIKEYKNQINSDVDVDSNFLENLIYCSKPHCLNILAVLNGSVELQDAIKKGEIRSLEKSAIIARAKTQGEKSFLLAKCLEGASLKQLKQEALQQKKLTSADPSLMNNSKKRPGKQATKINLGTTKNKAVILRLINLVVDHPLYSKFKEQLGNKPLDNYAACAQSFSELIRIMERIEND